MGGYVGGPEFKLLLYLQQKATRAAEPPTTYWALQRRHPDGRRWVEVARFAAERDARRALRVFAEEGGAEGVLRVRRVARAL